MTTVEQGWPPALKRTRTRAAVLEALVAADRPLSAAELACNCAGDGGRPVCLSTVYRALGAFQECGIVVRTPLPDGGGAVYEPAGRHQHYAICLGCSRTIAITNCPLDHFLPRLSEEDFQVMGHRLQMYGYCSACGEQTADK